MNLDQFEEHFQLLDISPLLKNKDYLSLSLLLLTAISTNSDMAHHYASHDFFDNDLEALEKYSPHLFVKLSEDESELIHTIWFDDKLHHILNQHMALKRMNFQQETKIPEEVSFFPLSVLYDKDTVKYYYNDCLGEALIDSIYDLANQLQAKIKPSIKIK